MPQIDAQDRVPERDRPLGGPQDRPVPTEDDDQFGLLVGALGERPHVCVPDAVRQQRIGAGLDPAHEAVGPEPLDEVAGSINGLGTLVVHSQGDVSWTHRASLTRRVGGLRDEVQEELLIAVLARQRARTTPHLAPACPDGCLGDLLHALLSPPLVEDDAA